MSTQLPSFFLCVVYVVHICMQSLQKKKKPREETDRRIVFRVFLFEEKRRRRVALELEAWKVLTTIQLSPVFINAKTNALFALDRSFIACEVMMGRYDSSKQTRN